MTKSLKGTKTELNLCTSFAGEGGQLLTTCDTNNYDSGDR